MENTYCIPYILYVIYTEITVIFLQNNCNIAGNVFLFLSFMDGICTAGWNSPSDMLVPFQGP